MTGNLTHNDHRAMIHLHGVRKAFNQGRPNELWALDGVDLHIEAGKATVLQGPSGSGKTTLLTVIGCLARPTAGRVHLDGRIVSALPERFLTEVRRHTFGFVFQRFNLLRGISVLENVMLPAYPLAPRRAQLRRRAGELLERLRLSHRADARSEWLSGGEAQRVAIARALVNDPPVVVADEPTANLDTHLSGEFLAIARLLKAEGKTLLLASHDPLIYGSDLVDKVVRMRDGRVMELPGGA
jgi:putative ABC transport system ATP-binding protein